MARSPCLSGAWRGTQVRLIDFDDPADNGYVVTNQWIFPSPAHGSRFDVVLLVNGIPLVIGEVKTPVRPAVTWVDGASDIHGGYEKTVPEMFVPNVFSFASEGRAYRYGSVGMPCSSGDPGARTARSQRVLSPTCVAR